MNTTKFTKEQQLQNWLKIMADVKEAKNSGVTISDWLTQHNLSKDKYYYWQRELKKAAILDSLPEIVSVPTDVIKPTTEACSDTYYQVSDNHTSMALNHVSISVNSVVIDVYSLQDPELLSNVIKAVRYA